MKKDSLEIKAFKSVVDIDKKMTDIMNLMRDLNMKLCYIIKDKKRYDDIFRGSDYLK